MKKLIIIVSVLFISSITVAETNFQQEYFKQKSWYSSTMSEFSYLEKLIVEKGDVKDAIIEYCDRIRRLNTVFVIESYDSISGKIPGAVAYYDYNCIHFPNFYNTTIGIHEFEHQITVGNFYMSEYAKNLYRQAFDSSVVRKDFLERNSNPTEIDANKKQVEFEMERLGIKKYSEKFTSLHYNKLMYCLSKGLFTNQGAIDFLKVIKAKYFCQIFNTIA